MLSRYLCVVTLAAVALPCIVSADAFKDPKRVVSGQTVNLTPLFDWSRHHNGDRAMPGWVRVSGTVTATNAYGWVLDARAGGVGGKKSNKAPESTKLILKNPPAQEYAAFTALRAQLRELHAQQAQLSKQKSHAEERATELAARQRGIRSRRARLLAREEQRAQAAAKTELKSVDKEIATVTKQLEQFPNKDHYTVDCFALKTGLNHNGLPVYDRGMPLR